MEEKEEKEDTGNDLFIRRCDYPLISISWMPKGTQASHIGKGKATPFFQVFFFFFLFFLFFLGCVSFFWIFN